MKRTVFIILLILAGSVCLSYACAASDEHTPDEISEAMLLMNECGGEPGEEEIEKLHELGFEDEDIEGMSILNTMRKDKRVIAPYIIIAAAVILLSAAAVTSAVLIRRRSA